jgi:cystathionine beta-lyase
MENYDFDRIVDRRGTDSVKWDGMERDFGRNDLLPFWVADMDFETPYFIRKAIIERLAHPVYAYSLVPESYWESIIWWEKRLHGWNISRESLTYIPGIVKGIGMVLQCFTQPGDGVVIQPPVYHPFRLVPQGMGRDVLYNPLLPDGVSYRMDLAGLEQICAERKPKVLILSNPHNPGGIAWQKGTLARVADICNEYGVLVVSDEIHADMPLFGHAIHSFATVSETAAMNCICFGAPTKTFNIAGLVSSFAVVPDPTIRKKFFSFLWAGELNDPTFIATTATKAAFSLEGDEWRRQMLHYVEGNIDYVDSYLKENIPSVKALRPEVSFLVWLDCRGLGLDQKALADLFINGAHLALNDGTMFGQGGEGYMRFNVGCPRALLREALERLGRALSA